MARVLDVDRLVALGMAIKEGRPRPVDPIIYEIEPDPIPEGSMRVGPGTDAVVWNTCKTHKGRPE